MEEIRSHQIQQGLSTQLSCLTFCKRLKPIVLFKINHRLNKIQSCKEVKYTNWKGDCLVLFENILVIRKELYICLLSDL